jgi:hypothetical protein
MDSKAVRGRNTAETMVRIRVLQKRRERTYRRWYSGELKSRPASRIIGRLTKKIEKIYKEQEQ